MKNLKVPAFVLTCLLVVSIFAFLPVFSTQPPVDSSTMNVGTASQPRNVDPSQAYDTVSGELIMNVYDSMLEFGSESTNTANKPVLPVPANDSVDVGSDVAALGPGTDVAGVCYLPTVTTYANGSSLWTFQVRTNVVFQPWQEPNGTWVIDENVTWRDIVYYFQRFFVQDSDSGPEWMLMSPAFNLSSFDQYQVDGGPSLGTSESYVASLIQSFVSGFSNATGQYVQLLFQGPPVGMWDILCETWSSIPPMQWSIDHGCWNDSFYSGWSADWRNYPNELYTPLDTHTARSLYGAAAEPAMCGTGPYCFTYWNQTNEQWRIDAFQAGFGNEPTGGIGCVSHPWPGPYGASEPACKTVIETDISSWSTRKLLFLLGDLDVVQVPTANMYDLLQSSSNPYLPVPGVVDYYDIPTLSTYGIFFTFNVTAGSSWMPMVNGSADPTFFNDIRVRYAFCQALNMSAYISKAWNNEATQPSSWWANGLTPTNANLNPGSGNPGTIPGWDINIANVYGNLTAAGITGFNLSIPYNVGSTWKQTAAQMITDTFNYINAWANGSTHYYCTPVGESNPSYINDVVTSKSPLFLFGWLADFSDADDLAEPFMATSGNNVLFALWQAYSNSTINNQVQSEEVLANAPVDLTPGSAYMNRTAMFKVLQQEYKQQAIGLPVANPLARFWQRDWVHGYYVNQLYGGNYYQDLYKKAVSVLSATSTAVTCTPTSGAVGSIFNCNATVSGSNLTGVITWSTSSNAGHFNQSVCALSSGSCSTTYTDNNTGYATITAVYSGDSNNSPSSGTAILTVFLNVTTGSNVTVAPTDTLALSFSNVTGAGTVVANETPTVPAPPIDPVAPFYTVKVTATFVGNVTVAVAFDGSGLTQQEEANLTMMMYTPIPGDVATPYGHLDMSDVITILYAFGSTPGKPNWNPACDFEGNGKIDMGDVIIALLNFGKTATWTNITTYVDTTNNIIYGNTTHFSFICVH